MANITNRPDDFVDQNHTHISAMAHTIIDDGDAVGDEEYWGYPVNSLISKSGKGVMNKELEIESLDYLLVEMAKSRELWENAGN